MFRCTPLSLTLALGDYPTQLHRKNFHKSHQFEFVNNVPLLAEVSLKELLRRAKRDILSLSG